ncbi:MAG: hypothetical protein ACO3ZW_00375 [Opitutales bacterium]
MHTVLRALRNTAIRSVALAQSTWLGWPWRVECNICGWQGRHFASDKWHRHINCPRFRAS